MVGGSPTASGEDCALDVYLQFLDDPTDVLDLSCLDEVLPPDFDGLPPYTTWLLGTSDAWGDAPSASLAPPVRSPIRLAAPQLERARQVRSPVCSRHSAA